MEIVELVNRTSQDQVFTYNSREYKVPAKRSVHLERHCAVHGMNRCIYRLDPMTGSYHHKLGIRVIEEVGGEQKIKEEYDCTPIDYEPEENEELIDREAMGEEVTLVPVNPKASLRLEEQTAIENP